MACRYFMRLAYNGTPFHGWQRQPNAVSVQEELERALSMVLRQPVAQDRDIIEKHIRSLQS